MKIVAMLMVTLTACANAEPDDTDADAAVAACKGPLQHADSVRTATRSPDGEGWCCAADFPTCDCASFGGFVKDRCGCGNLEARWCDLAPPDWIPETDKHGCRIYTARSPLTACCNCRNAPSP